MSTRILMLVCAVALISNAEENRAPDETQLKRWIAELGADEFETRLNAFRNLKHAGPSAEAVLERARSSEDVELNARVKDLLQPLYSRRAKIKEWTAISERLGPVFGADLKVMPYADDNAPELPAEAHVDSQLKWLAESQEEDGHWDSVKHGAQQNADVEQTSFALLAFLGAGHTEKVGEFKANVKRAVSWLSSHVGEDGGVRLGDEKEVHGLRQALAGLALAEASGMANIAATKALAQKVVDHSCQKHQSGDGGFGLAPKAAKTDLLTTTLFVFQLKSAKVAGLKVPLESFDGVIKFLDSLENKERGFSFAAGLDPSPRATAMGLVCRQFLGWKREDLEGMAGRFVKDYGDPAAAGSDDLCNWIAQLAMFQQGGELWPPFNNGIRRTIYSRARNDEKFKGSIDPRGEWTGAGRVFSTSVDSLCLEVYYRYQQLR